MILLVSLWLIGISAAKACDICGCGVGSYYLGILPEYSQRFAGLRYQFKTLSTHLGPDGQATPLSTEEVYQSAELWGGWNFGKRWRVLSIVPYHFIQKENQRDRGRKNGPGDIALMGYYKVFDHMGMAQGKLLVQSFWVGGGVKLPTGRYESGNRQAGTQDPNIFQLGTKSTDMSLHLAYDIRWNDLGLNLNANYKMNTANSDQYRYGNKWTMNGLVYHKFRVFRQFTLAPNAGILYETAARDVEEKQFEVAVSGGYSLSAVAGIEWNSKSISFGANYQHVSRQSLAEGRVKAGSRWMLHASIPF